MEDKGVTKMKIWVIVAITLGLAINDIFGGNFLEKPIQTTIGLVVTFIVLNLLNFIYIKFIKKENNK